MFELVTKQDSETALALRRSSRLAISYDAVAPSFAFADFVIIVASSIVGGDAYQLAISNAMGDVAAFAGMGILAGAAYCVGAHQMGLYQIQSLLQRRQDYWRIIACVTLVALLLSVILFLLKMGSQFSRGSVICFVGLVMISLVAWRVTVKSQLKKSLISGAVRGRRTLIIGQEDELAKVNKESLLIEFGIDEIQRIVLPRHSASRRQQEARAIDSAIAAARNTAADELLLCIPWGDRILLQTILHQLRVLPLPLRLMPDTFIRSIREQGNGTTRLGLVEIQRGPLSRSEQFVKRIFDILAASFSLLIMMPLMILTAVALKLESTGPIIFRQRRRGFNGRAFEIYKFRTMTVLEDGSHVRQARQNDARVTRIGRILRRTSIDELPQLFNVLRGEMSIVGPRPHAVAHDEEYSTLISNYAFRHHMKPGITGLAQVNGLRGGTPEVKLMQQRVEQDLWYINNWSLMLDVQIAARTCFELLRPQNAY